MFDVQPVDLYGLITFIQIHFGARDAVVVAINIKYSPWIKRSKNKNKLFHLCKQCHTVHFVIQNTNNMVEKGSKGVIGEYLSIWL